MKKNKLLILIFTILFAFTCSTVYAKVYIDVFDDSAYYDAISVLSDKGIINGYTNGTFLADRPISRAEAAAIISRATGISSEKSTKSIYKDVPDTYWGCKYIMFATNKGILNGMGNGMFEPESNVTNNQIIKMIICMIGEEYEAEINGGWPKGYIKTALDHDIINSNQYNSFFNRNWGDDAATRGDVAQFIYNAIIIPDEYKLTVGNNEYYIGMDASDLGTPDEIKPSVYGFTWYVFGTKTYKDFFVAGVERGKVTALASSGNSFLYNGYKAGDIYDDSSEYSYFLYIDENDHNKIHGVFISKGVYADDKTLSALAGESKLNFHFTNAFRLYHGLKTLLWDDRAAAAARSHSEDMAKNNYIAHNSLDGAEFTSRLEKQGINNWRYSAENICAGLSSGFKAYDCWVNSDGHRKNLLSDTEYLGVGAAYRENSTYSFFYTQDYFR